MSASQKSPQWYQPDQSVGTGANVLQFSTPAYTSTNSTAMVTGSDFDATIFGTISITAQVATNAVTWSVWGANLASYADAVQLQAPASIAASAVGTYTAYFAPYAYYFVKAIDTVGGTHGTITLNVVAKTP